jgi:hypothetical protein
MPDICGRLLTKNSIPGVPKAEGVEVLLTAIHQQDYKPMNCLDIL